MMNKFSTRIALAVFVAPVLAHAAVTRAADESLATSPVIKGKSASYRAEAQQVLKQLVADGVPVKQALAVVEASAANRFSAADLRQVAQQTVKTVAAARAGGADAQGAPGAVSALSAQLIAHYRTAPAVTRILGAEQTALARHVPMAKVLQVTTAALDANATDRAAAGQIVAYNMNGVRGSMPQEIESLQRGAAAMTTPRALSSMPPMMPGANGTMGATMTSGGGMASGGGMTPGR